MLLKCMNLLEDSERFRYYQTRSRMIRTAVDFILGQWKRKRRSKNGLSAVFVYAFLLQFSLAQYGPDVTSYQSAADVIRNLPPHMRHLMISQLRDARAIRGHKIRPIPCRGKGGARGVCMFIWECSKLGGTAIGICTDRFMFGGCCQLTVASSTSVTASSTSTTQGWTSLLTAGSGSSYPSTPAWGSGTGVSRPVSVESPRPPDRPSTISWTTGEVEYNRPDRPSTIAWGDGSDVAYDKENEVPVEKHPPTKRPPVAAALVWQKPTTLWERPTRPTRHPPPSVVTSRPAVVVHRPTSTTTTPKTTTTTRRTTTRITTPSTTTTRTTTTRRTSMSTTQATTTAPNTPETSEEASTPWPRPTRPTRATRPPTPSTPSSPTYTSPPSTSPSPALAEEITKNTSSSAAQKKEKESNLCTVSATGESGKNAECGVPPLFPNGEVAAPAARIVGGRPAPFGSFPWQVSVRRTSFFGLSTTHRCGGALLNEQWAATAGHCVDDLLLSQIRIRVGEYDFGTLEEPYPYQERHAVKKIVHPNYNYFSYEHDLALVKLDRPVKLMPNVHPICLPANDDLMVGDNATLTGWGRLSEGGVQPSILRQATVPIIENDKCKQMFKKAGKLQYIPDIFLCAGYEDGGIDACQGDSGGPVQIRGKDGRWFLAGIISWGIGCAEPNQPGVSTRISKFREWIIKQVTEDDDDDS